MWDSMLGSVGFVGPVAPGELARGVCGKGLLRQSTWSSWCRGESVPLWPEPEDPDRYSVRRRDCPPRYKHREQIKNDFKTDITCIRVSKVAVESLIMLHSNIANKCCSFTFMHLADAFIQSDLHCIQVTVLHFISSCFPWESNPWSWRC